MCLINYSDKAFFYTHLACGALSCLGSLIIIIYYILHKKTQVLSYRLVYYLSITQCISSLEYMIPISVVDKSEGLCSLVGVITNSTQLISVVWMTYISITIYQVVAGKSLFIEKKPFFWTFIAWVGFPVLNLIPIFTKTYRREGETCTYSQDFLGTIERVLIYYLPAWVLLTLSVFYFVKVFYIIRRFEVEKTYVLIIKRLMVYPIIMSFNVILLTLIRIFAYMASRCQISVIEYFFYGIIGLNGFFNFLVFITTPGNRFTLRNVIANESKSDQMSEESSSSILNPSSSMY